MKYVNKPVPKTDAMSLVTGKPVYTDDLAPSDCLIVKILRSPHANAWVEENQDRCGKEDRGDCLCSDPMRMFLTKDLLWPDRQRLRSVHGIVIS